MDYKSRPIDTPLSNYHIKVVGVGPAGCNAVARMAKSGIHGVTFICVNNHAPPDAKPSPACQHVDLFSPMLDANGARLKSKDRQQATAAVITAAIEGSDLLFIVTSMDIGIKSTLARMVAKLARKTVLLTVGVVMVPAARASDYIWELGETELARFERCVDSFVLLPHEALPGLPGEEDSAKKTLHLGHGGLPTVMVSQISGIFDTNSPQSTYPGLGDLRYMLCKPGKVTFGTAIASGPDCAQLAAKKVLDHPFFADIEFPKSDFLVVVVATAKVDFLEQTENQKVISGIYSQTPPNTVMYSHFICDDTLGEGIRVSMIVKRLE